MLIKLRSSHQRCSMKKGVIRNFTKFTGKHLCQSLFFNKVAGLLQTLTQVFSCEFCEISKNTFFTEHIWMAASKKFRFIWMAKLNTCKFTFEINVIVFFSFVSDASHHFVVSFWWKSSTTFQFTIEISFIVVSILYQVFQVTLWLDVGQVTFVARFSYKSSTTFHCTTEICFIVDLILHQVL